METSTGDLLLAGMRDLEEDMFGSWLVKIGADGCYDPADCGGIKDTIYIHEEVVATASPQAATQVLTAFPNPTDGAFTVHLPTTHGLREEGVLRVFDVQGRAVHPPEFCGRNLYCFGQRPCRWYLLA